MLSETTVKLLGPRDQRKSKAIVDHCEPSGCELDALAIDARHLPGRSALAVGQPMFTRNCGTGVGKVALAQGAKQIAGQGETVAALMGKTFAFQKFQPARLGCFNFAAEPRTER